MILYTLWEKSGCSPANLLQLLSSESCFVSWGLCRKLGMWNTPATKYFPPDPWPCSLCSSQILPWWTSVETPPLSVTFCSGPFAKARNKTLKRHFDFSTLIIYFVPSDLNIKMFVLTIPILCDRSVWCGKWVLYECDWGVFIFHILTRSRPDVHTEPLAGRIMLNSVVINMSGAAQEQLWYPCFSLSICWHYSWAGTLPLHWLLLSGTDHTLTVSDKHHSCVSAVYFQDVSFDGCDLNVF